MGASAYTRERLEEAARGARTLSEALERLDVDPRSPTRREETSAHALRVPNSRLRRALSESGVQERCALCGIDGTWLGSPLPLEVDHIDGNWRNNRIGNLRLLCPNCHSATDTYRGRGKRRRKGAAA